MLIDISITFLLHTYYIIFFIFNNNKIYIVYLHGNQNNSNREFFKTFHMCTKTISLYSKLLNFEFKFCNI